MDASRLRAVVRTLRQVEVLNRNGHLGLVSATGAEVPGPDRPRRLHAWALSSRHRPKSSTKVEPAATAVTREMPHVQDELVEVRALFHVASTVAHLEYRE